MTTPIWIATRKLTLDATGEPVEISIGAPEPVEGSPWRCAIRVTVAGKSHDSHATGLDSLQALVLALVVARREVHALGATSWLSPGRHRMPYVIPDVFAAEFTQSLIDTVERLVEEHPPVAAGKRWLAKKRAEDTSEE
jgi:hypothetical protein